MLRHCSNSLCSCEVTGLEAERASFGSAVCSECERQPKGGHADAAKKKAEQDKTLTNLGGGTNALHMTGVRDRSSSGRCHRCTGEILRRDEGFHPMYKYPSNRPLHFRRQRTFLAAASNVAGGLHGGYRLHGYKGSGTWNAELY